MAQFFSDRCRHVVPGIIRVSGVGQVFRKLSTNTYVHMCLSFEADYGFSVVKNLKLCQTLKYTIHQDVGKKIVCRADTRV